MLEMTTKQCALLVILQLACISHVVEAGSGARHKYRLDNKRIDREADDYEAQVDADTDEEPSSQQQETHKPPNTGGAVPPFIANVTTSRSSAHPPTAAPQSTTKRPGPGEGGSATTKSPSRPSPGPGPSTQGTTYGPANGAGGGGKGGGGEYSSQGGAPPSYAPPLPQPSYAPPPAPRQGGYNQQQPSQQQSGGYDAAAASWNQAGSGGDGEVYNFNKDANEEGAPIDSYGNKLPYIEGLGYPFFVDRKFYYWRKAVPQSSSGGGYGQQPASVQPSYAQPPQQQQSYGQAPQEQQRPQGYVQQQRESYVPAPYFLGLPGQQAQGGGYPASQGYGQQAQSTAAYATGIQGSVYSVNRPANAPSYQPAPQPFLQQPQPSQYSQQQQQPAPGPYQTQKAPYDKDRKL